MIRVYMLEMARSDVFNGVSRCIQTLTNTLSREPNISVSWLRLLYWGDSRSSISDIEGTKCCHRYLLPYGMNGFLVDSSRKSQCWEDIYQRYFSLLSAEDRCIFHIHTLNLIDFANFLKKRLGGYVVTHLHCLPWKLLYDRDYTHYQCLYKTYHVDKVTPTWDKFIFADCEKKAYLTSDTIICVTKCAIDFLLSLGVDRGKLFCVPNGLPDTVLGEVGKQMMDEVPIILFVGNANPSKGLELLLRGLCKIHHCVFRVLVAGPFEMAVRQRILENFPGLDIRFTGQVALKELSKLYTSASVGVIPSLHEQCSYVAIEMMMFGLPVVCTAIDGLNEMFRDGVTALTVPLSLSDTNDYILDENMLAQTTTRLLTDVDLQHQLSKNSRAAYLDSFTDERMCDEILEIYTLLTKN